MQQGKDDNYYFKPHNDLIPRELTEDQSDYFHHLSKPIEEVVNFGSDVLTWRIQVFENEEFLNVPIMLLREAMDLTDSCSILLRQGAADTSKVLTRSLFEISLYMGYLCKSDLRKRSYAYLLSSVLDNIKYHESVLQEFSLKSRAHKQSLSEEQVHEIEILIEGKKSLFQTYGYADAYSYYQKETARRKAKGIRKKLDTWYSYYEGPDNLRGLSKELGAEDAYQFFYSKYSKLAHGNEAFLGKMVPNGENSADMYQLRSFVDIKEVCQYTFAFSTSIVKRYVQTIFPERLEFLNIFSSWCLQCRTFYQ